MAAFIVRKGCTSKTNLIEDITDTERGSPRLNEGGKAHALQYLLREFTLHQIPHS